MNIEELTVNEVRVLANEMISKAKSGHPGIALSAAPILYTLYAKHLRINPKEPNHILRDRFVLSAGHGSALLYTLLYAMGYAIKEEDLKAFRKLGSLTPGHPEIECVGVDASTGPLGQGVANAVGMAIAEKHAESVYNTSKVELFDNKIYCLVGDGCLMEGVAYEALSLAGTLQLDNLIILYDCNKVTIDNRISDTFKMNPKKMMEALGYFVLEVKDGNDIDQIDEAITKAKVCGKPSFIICNTLIGYGSMYEDTLTIHGNPLSEEDLQKLREKLNVTKAEFSFSSKVKAHLEKVKQEIKERFVPLKDKLASYKKVEKQNYQKLQMQLEGCTINGQNIVDNIQYEEGISTRELSGKVLNECASLLPQMLCGSADLKGSTKCEIKNAGFINSLDARGRNIAFGIREHGMAAIANGVALFLNNPIVVSTFLSFVDYMKGAVRMSAMMNLPILYVLTHDSIQVGEDGPTHQPVEQITSLRATPNLSVWRPCNLSETVACYTSFLSKQNATCLIGSRQKLGKVDSNIEDALRGGYVLSEAGKGNIEGIIIATGSEVELALKAQIALLKNGYNVRVVSMPCIEVFLAQPESYRKTVLPPRIKSILAVEANDGTSWYQFTGVTGAVISMDTFGKSGKASEVLSHFGFTQKRIEKEMITLIKRNHSKEYGVF